MHVELSLAGAQGRTPFFTSGAVDGTCTPACQGNTVLNMDCSTIDCSANGTQRLPGATPRCSDPPPPERPEAVRVAGINPPGVALQGTPSRVTFSSNKRLFDTRDPATSTSLRRSDGSRTGRLKAGGANTWSDPGALFADAKGVWLNMAAIRPAAQGFVAVTSAGQAQPATSSLNYAASEVSSNLGPVMLGANKGVDFFSAPGDTHLIADLMATLTPDGDGMTSFGPTRVLDTRSFDGALQANQTREVDLRLPPGSTGVATTLTVIRPEGAGFLSVWACGDPEPPTSNVNYAAQSVKASSVVSKITPDGKLCIKSSQQTHIALDISGHFSDDGPLSYQSLQPVRLMDTRLDTSIFQNRLGARQSIELPIQQLSNMPDAIWSVVTNITVVGADSNGFATVYPCGAGVPGTSSVNFNATGAHS